MTWRSLGDSNPCFRRERATQGPQERRTLGRPSIEVRNEWRNCGSISEVAGDDLSVNPAGAHAAGAIVMLLCHAGIRVVE
jgi:hypothetical protein